MEISALELQQLEKFSELVARCVSESALSQAEILQRGAVLNCFAIHLEKVRKHVADKAINTSLAEAQPKKALK